MNRGLRLVRCFVCKARFANKTGLYPTVCKDGKTHLLCYTCQLKEKEKAQRRQETRQTSDGNWW